MTCVVTGAARGIGLEIARVLADAGGRVVLADIDPTALNAALESMKRSDAAAVCADVSSGASLQTVVEACTKRFGPPSIWVNNAGVARHRPIVDYPEEEIDRMIAVNLKGLILGSQAALRSMIPARQGHIINILSTAALRGIPTETVYCATKWGARGFTQGLREEAAPHGIRVSALLPGGVATDFWQLAAPERRMPVGDFLTPRQVAEAVLSLVRLDAGVVAQELVLRSQADRDFAHG